MPIELDHDWFDIRFVNVIWPSIADRFREHLTGSCVCGEIKRDRRGLFRNICDDSPVYLSKEERSVVDVTGDEALAILTEHPEVWEWSSDCESGSTLIEAVADVLRAELYWRLENVRAPALMTEILGPIPPDTGLEVFS